MAKVSNRSYRLVKAYVRKDGKRVKAHYRQVKAITYLPHPRKGMLSKYGYRPSVSTQGRKSALKKAIRAHGWQTVVRELTLIANLTYRSQPKNSNIYNADKAWVRSSFGKK